MKNGDQPARPHTIVTKSDAASGAPIETIEHLGLTKREYFAGLAMQSLAGLEFQSSESHSIDKAERVVSQSIRLADELLKQLEQ